jgi:hypothetical protein
LRNWWQFFTLKFKPVICCECYEVCFCAVTGVIFYRIAAITYKKCTPKIHRRVEETLTDLTRHILMYKVTKCLYKKLFYRDTNPTQLAVSSVQSSNTRAVGESPLRRFLRCDYWVVQVLQIWRFCQMENSLKQKIVVFWLAAKPSRE